MATSDARQLDAADRLQLVRWALEWIAHWNARDLDAILARYRDDVRFDSPLAERVTGSALVEGKDALRRYWARALDEIHLRAFELERVIWDPARREIVVVYVAELDGQRTRGCDLMSLDAAGQVIRADACFGSRLGNRATPRDSLPPEFLLVE